MALQKAQLKGFYFHALQLYELKCGLFEQKEWWIIWYGKCGKCDVAFQCNSTRHHHNQKVHEAVEFLCDICGKDFAFKKGLLLMRRVIWKVTNQQLFFL